MYLLKEDRGGTCVEDIGPVVDEKLILKDDIVRVQDVGGGTQTNK